MIHLALKLISKIGQLSVLQKRLFLLTVTKDERLSKTDVSSVDVLN